MAAWAPEGMKRIRTLPEGTILSTPAPGGLTVTADKDTYNVGDAIVVTLTLDDGQTVPVSLDVSAQVTDGQGNVLTGTTTVTVNTSQPGTIASGSVSDSFGDVYTQQGDVAGNTVVFAGTVGTPPAA